MSLAIVLAVVVRLDAGVESFEAIDARVAAELARVKREEHDQHETLLRSQRTRVYVKPIPVPPFDITAVRLTGEYVEACLGLSGRKRACAGPDQISVEWILANRPGGFESILEWTATHGTPATVPRDPVGRLVSLQQALELSLVDHSHGR